MQPVRHAALLSTPDDARQLTYSLIPGGGSWLKSTTHLERERQKAPLVSQGSSAREFFSMMALTCRIYPIASAGGYQLLGRTLSTWKAWAENHSIVDNFDQIEFFPVSEDDLVKVSDHGVRRDRPNIAD